VGTVPATRNSETKAMSMPRISRTLRSSSEGASAGSPIVGCGNEQLLSQSGDGFSRR